MFVFLLFCVAGSALGQVPKCSIGSTSFACPDNYFTEIKLKETDIRAFRYKSEGSTMVFYVAVPNGVFDQTKVGGSLFQAVSGKNNKFVWKRLGEVFEMNTSTKYKYDLVSYLGMSDDVLIEIKAFFFNINGKKIILGYLQDWKGSKSENKRRYDAASSIGGSGPGCNEVVTVLNSITKEFPEKEQYCTLMTFTTN